MLYYFMGEILQLALASSLAYQPCPYLLKTETTSVQLLKLHLN